MLTKTDVIRSFEGLPENVSAEQLIEKILFLKRIDKGLEQAKNNEIISNEEVMEYLKNGRESKS